MSQRTPRVSIVAVALLAVALTGCGSRRPPGVTVTNGHDVVHLEAVSYCWSGRCADGILRTDTATPIALSRGVTLRVRSSGFRGARSIGASSRPLGGSGWFGPDTVVPFEHEGTSVVLMPPSASGRYQINVGFSRDGGDAGYAFIIEVK